MLCDRCHQLPALENHAWCRSCNVNEQPTCSCGLPLTLGVCLTHCDIKAPCGICDPCFTVVQAIHRLDAYLSTEAEAEPA